MRWKMACRAGSCKPGKPRFRLWEKLKETDAQRGVAYNFGLVENQLN
jgi:hypothetical protein